jgi:hypothetical protein
MPVAAPIDNRRAQIRPRVVELGKVLVHPLHGVLGKVLGDIVASRQEVS